MFVVVSNDIKIVPGFKRKHELRDLFTRKKVVSNQRHVGRATESFTVSWLVRCAVAQRSSNYCTVIGFLLTFRKKTRLRRFCCDDAYILARFQVLQ